MRKGSCCSPALVSATLPCTRVPHPDRCAGVATKHACPDRHHMCPDRQTPGPWGHSTPPHRPHVLQQKALTAYLEVEDNRPYEPQGELGVAICNVVIADVHQFHLKEKQNGQNPVSHPGGTVPDQAAPRPPGPTTPGAQRGTAPPAPLHPQAGRRGRGARKRGRSVPLLHQQQKEGFFTAFACSGRAARSALPALNALFRFTWRSASSPEP